MHEYTVCAWHLVLSIRDVSNIYVSLEVCDYHTNNNKDENRTQKILVRTAAKNIIQTKINPKRTKEESKKKWTWYLLSAYRVRRTQYE